MDDFHQYFSDIHLPTGQYFFQETKYGYLPSYPVATGILLTPFYVLPVSIYNQPNRTLADWFQFAKLAQKVSASIMTALSLSLFYLLAVQLNASRPLAFVLTIAYGFATEAWTISSQALWQHGPGSLFMILAALLAIKQLKKPSMFKGISFGLACGFAVAIRPTNLLFVLPIYIWMIAKRPRFTLSYTWPLGLIGIGLASYNLIALGNIRGAELMLTPFTTPFWEGFWGLLISPGRGLFIYFPLAIFGLLGFYKSFREKQIYLSFYGVLFVFVILQIALYSKYLYWWGGNSFGPRYLTEIQPMLLLLSIPLLSNTSRESLYRKGFYLLLICSFFIQLIGVLEGINKLNWNHFPEHINVSQNRLWNWKYNPVSWEFRREIGRIGEGKWGLISFITENAEAGDTESQEWLGEIYQNGADVEKNDVEAVKWYRKAAEQGNPNGQFNLAVMYAQGLGVAKDDAEAVKWYRRSAEQGNSNGEVNLGIMYANGFGLNRDYVEAVKWFRMAAEQGNPKGQINLGVMYVQGLGMAKDDVEAVKWYRKAAEQGNPFGQLNLGVMYANGLGLDKDYFEAVKWVRKSVDQGNAEAQVMLGLFFENGYGVAKNETEALKWYRKAAEQGNVLGKNNVRRISHEGSQDPN